MIFDTHASSRDEKPVFVFRHEHALLGLYSNSYTTNPIGEESDEIKQAMAAKQATIKGLSAVVPKT